MVPLSPFIIHHSSLNFVNFPFFIARRVAAAGSRSFARLIIYIAIAAVALSISVMIIATALISGFKSEISSKMFGFWGHIHIVSAAGNTTLEPKPISLNVPFYRSLDSIRTLAYETPEGKTMVTHGGVKHVQAYITKPGIITVRRNKDDDSKKNFEGVILKGVGKDYDWTFLNEHLVEGRKILNSTDSALSRDILISQTTADRLLLKNGDKFIVHFIQENQEKKRVFQVCGLYKTGLEEYDRKFAIVDMAQLQDLMGWGRDSVSGFEVVVDDLRDLDAVNEYIHKEVVPSDMYATTVRDEQPAIFQWLDLQDVNEQIIIGLMLLVSIINMATTLLILILERSNMIGALKALGATNWSVQKIFLFYGAIIVGAGLLAGNVLGVGLSWLQQRFHFIKLSEADYYLSVAPIQLSFWNIAALNLGVFAVTLVFLCLPSFLVTTITPVKTLRFK